MWFGLVFLYPNQIIVKNLGGKQVPPLQPLESPLVGKCKQNLAKKSGSGNQRTESYRSDYFIIVS